LTNQLNDDIVINEMSTPEDQKIFRNLAIAKMIFFCGSMGGVGWSRFQNVFYLEHGMSGSQIGILKSIGMMLKIFGEPFWCIVADVTESHKLLFSVCLLMQISTLEMLRFLPINFGTILLVKILRTTTAPSGTFTTTACFALTKGSKEGYGQQRMFGALAWGGGALLVGFLVDWLGMSSIFWYTNFFNITTLLLVLFAVPAQIFRRDHMPGHDQGSGSTCELRESDGGSVASRRQSSVTVLDCKASVHRYLAELRRFLRHRPCRALLLYALLYGIVMTVPDTFLYVSLERDFHASRTFSGLCTLLSTLSELPVFWHADQLLRQHGHRRAMTIAQIALAIRLAAYALLSPSWPASLALIALVQLTHGAAFALFWSAAVDAVRLLAPPGLGAGSLAALNTFYFTLAGASGAAVWGVMYDAGGAVSVYLGGLAVLGAASAYLVMRGGLLDHALAASASDEDLSSLVDMEGGVRHRAGPDPEK
jgi:MFS transporter, PPP family, 3-phenylpropionic acid transporter